MKTPLTIMVDLLEVTLYLAIGTVGIAFGAGWLLRHFGPPHNPP